MSPQARAHQLLTRCRADPALSPRAELLLEGFRAAVTEIQTRRIHPDAKRRAICDRRNLFVAELANLLNPIGLDDSGAHKPLPDPQ